MEIDAIPLQGDNFQEASKAEILKQEQLFAQLEKQQRASFTRRDGKLQEKLNNRKRRVEFQTQQELSEIKAENIALQNALLEKDQQMEREKIQLEKEKIELEKSKNATERARLELEKEKLQRNTSSVLRKLDLLHSNRVLSEKETIGGGEFVTAYKPKPQEAEKAAPRRGSAIQVRPAESISEVPTHVNQQGAGKKIRYRVALIMCFVALLSGLIAGAVVFSNSGDNGNESGIDSAGVDNGVGSTETRTEMPTVEPTILLNTTLSPSLSDASNMPDTIITKVPTMIPTDNAQPEQPRPTIYPTMYESHDQQFSPTHGPTPSIDVAIGNTSSTQANSNISSLVPTPIPSQEPTTNPTAHVEPQQFQQYLARNIGTPPIFPLQYRQPFQVLSRCKIILKTKRMYPRQVQQTQVKHRQIRVRKSRRRLKRQHQPSFLFTTRQVFRQNHKRLLLMTFQQTLQPHNHLHPLFNKKHLSEM